MWFPKGNKSWKIPWTTMDWQWIVPLLMHGNFVDKPPMNNAFSVSLDIGEVPLNGSGRDY